MEREMFVVGVFMFIVGIFVAVFGAIYTLDLKDLVYRVAFSFPHPVWALPSSTGVIHVDYALNIIGGVAAALGVTLTVKSTTVKESA
ncbi:MAG: hypothetical protein QXI37_04495 [Thermoprotei archaeon]